MSLWREIIERKIATLHDSGVDKRMDLAQALRRFVRPGMKINPVTMQSRPTAALHELCRQFAGKAPGFEFISSSLSGSYLQLVHLGLIRKAVDTHDSSTLRSRRYSCSRSDPCPRGGLMRNQVTTGALHE